jgi:peptidoglycan/xylan/chitin deacetylase (PgdA/CDA1 family)
MKIVSPLLQKVVYPALSSVGAFRRSSASGLAIITYHGVLPAGYQSVDAAFDGNLVTQEAMRRQLRFLKKHYHVIAPDDVLAWLEHGRELPQRAVLLTCDDGLLNCLTDMLPVLLEEQLSCLFFVTSASAEEVRTTLWYEDLFLIFLQAPAGMFAMSSEGIDLRGELGSWAQRQAFWWESVKRLSQVNAAQRKSFLRALRSKFGLAAEAGLEESGSARCRRYGLLTRVELVRLAEAGMSIGAHTLSHPMLSQMPPELAFAEISDSRALLTEALQRRVWAFAYPFGDPQSVTPEVLAMPQKAGYAAAFLNFGGGLDNHLPPFSLPRIHVTAAMGLGELDAHLSGFYARLRRGIGRG